MPRAGRLIHRTPEGDFNVVLRDLMERHEISFRRLSAATEGRLSAAYLQQLAAGKSRPTVENMQVIARALSEDPSIFREYRDYLAADEATRVARQVGLKPVLEALRRLDGVKTDD